MGRHRDLSAEWLVNKTTGPIHATIPEGVKKGKTPGQIYDDPEIIRICTECPYEECLLDINRRCRRFKSELNKLRKERQNNNDESL